MIVDPLLGSLALPALVAEWRSTERLLRDPDLPRNTSRHVRIARLRECLLDEFERRDPLGLGYWLHSGGTVLAVPARDLSAFLIGLGRATDIGDGEMGSGG